MKWIAIAGAALLTLAALAAIAGWALPVGHEASRTAALSAPPGAVWSAITDVTAFPSWRSDVTRVERLPDRQGYIAWVEEGRSGRLTFVVERSDPPRTLVTRIADPDLPFGGTWTYEIAPSATGSTLTITERGEIYNPFFRVMARFVFGYESTLDSYLESLRGKLQE